MVGQFSYNEYLGADYLGIYFARITHCAQPVRSLEINGIPHKKNGTNQYNYGWENQALNKQNHIVISSNSVPVAEHLVFDCKANGNHNL